MTLEEGAPLQVTAAQWKYAENPRRVQGTGTVFTALSPGEVIYDGGTGEFIGYVASVSSDTELFLTDYLTDAVNARPWQTGTSALELTANARHEVTGGAWQSAIVSKMKYGFAATSPGPS